MSLVSSIKMTVQKIRQFNQRQTPNFIPDDAIRASEIAKTPLPQKKVSSDSFSEDKVAIISPTREEVKATIPDDSVMPG